MPELPEVETVRLQLWRQIRGKTISAVEVRHVKSVRDDNVFAKKLSQLTIEDIDRVGKLLIFSFKGQPDLFLLVHLKMTGQLFLVDKKGKRQAEGGHETGLDDTLPNRHTRVVIDFVEGPKLFFNDQRIFGYLSLTDKKGLERARSRFGPEPHQGALDFTYFFNRLQKSGRNLKALLLDQSFIAGLGNIYVDEALFRAGLNPTRLAREVTVTEAQKLMREAGKVLNEAIKQGGTTFQSFKDSTGQKGNYSQKLKVFGRHGQPCPRCGHTIVKTRVAGRGTHFCPECQS